MANTAYSNAFDYDGMGNRTRVENVSGGDTSVTHTTPNALNQLSALSSSLNGAPAQTSGFGYDQTGNTTEIKNPDSSKTLFSYDDADRLVGIEKRSAADAPLSRSEFVYDYASRKAVSREFTWTNGAWVKTGEKRRVFDGLDVVQERNAQNEVTAQLVRDGNIGGILARSTQAGATFFGYDGGGNVTLLTDENGDDVGRYRYDAFGNTLEASGARAAENPYRFSTKELHGASGLYDFGFRFYSPGLGRWINRDPIEEAGGVNLYEMVGNDPVNSVDAYGLYATVKVEGNNVKIYIPMQFHGSGATSAKISMIKRGIESTWTGTFGKYKVQTFVVAPKKGVNFNKIEISSGNGVASCIWGRYGNWPAGSTSAWTAAHEAGHLMNLGDRYSDNKLNQILGGKGSLPHTLVGRGT